MASLRQPISSMGSFAAEYNQRFKPADSDNFFANQRHSGYSKELVGVAEGYLRCRALCK
jgi:hypothetical protein